MWKEVCNARAIESKTKWHEKNQLHISFRRRFLPFGTTDKDLPLFSRSQTETETETGFCTFLLFVCYGFSVSRTICYSLSNYTLPFYIDIHRYTYLYKSEYSKICQHTQSNTKGDGKNGQCSWNKWNSSRMNCCVNLLCWIKNGQNKSCNKCWIGSKTAIGFVRLVPLAIMVVLI